MQISGTPTCLVLSFFLKSDIWFISVLSNDLIDIFHIIHAQCVKRPGSVWKLISQWVDSDAPQLLTWLPANPPHQPAYRGCDFQVLVPESCDFESYISRVMTSFSNSKRSENYVNKVNFGHFSNKHTSQFWTRVPKLVNYWKSMGMISRWLHIKSHPNVTNIAYWWWVMVAIHNNAITWVSWRLKTPTDRMFVLSCSAMEKTTKFHFTDPL